jgi:hypothetical protein
MFVCDVHIVYIGLLRSIMVLQEVSRSVVEPTPTLTLSNIRPPLTVQNCSSTVHGHVTSSGTQRVAPYRA